MKKNTTNTKNKSARKRHSLNTTNHLELILKEFELAYNLGPGIPNTMKNELKKEFLRILEPVTQTIVRSRKFSFDLEKLLVLQDHTV